ncbi:hypothetical protein EDD16DRAFT_1492305 [Pisolithus croceorrhizus]|nr:hypothetical protein EDD16DRAFT_1492305 [Pisolithus croceorrhizus]KAI6116587.1 hypothetical protein EV401DRAFT_1973914 [Pisolithus croceorrhizus]KAI6159447.1 hypothetical protein EDD17DRAFT_1486812 [Pisolithus thermaeus]
MIKRPLPPSHLFKVLQNLNTGPRLALDRNLRTIRLRMAKDKHVGARHFVKEELPRIRWANPALDIQVVKAGAAKPQTREQGEQQDEVTRKVVRPTMELEYENGTIKTMDISHKWSTTITKELMDVAGGDAWKAYRMAALKAGHPLLPGEERERVVAAGGGAQTGSATGKAGGALSRRKGERAKEVGVQEMLDAPDRPKVGAAAILP